MVLVNPLLAAAAVTSLNALLFVFRRIDLCALVGWEQLICLSIGV